MKTKIKPHQKIAIDTSFAIALANYDHPLHKNAVEFLDFFKQAKSRFYISAIVASEFSIGGDIKDVYAILTNESILPVEVYYENRDAERYKVIAARHPQMFRGGQVMKERAVNDMMILAHMERAKVEAIISADVSMCEVFTQGTIIKGININATVHDYIVTLDPSNMFHPNNLN